MFRSRRSLLAATVIAFLAACGGTASGPAILRARPPRTTLPGPSGSCHGGVLPDPTCTPGATNPQVTQGTIKSTICVRGWTATIRPPVSYTGPLKLAQMKAYGFPGPASLYEEDHLISLELGGSPTDPHNLWPEPYAGAQGARIKDRVENLLRSRVCAGTESLDQAQHDIATDWTAVH